MLLADIIKLKSSLLKSSASLANVTAKLFFLQICANKGLVPKGFGLKFSLQTGLPDEFAVDSCQMVDDILNEASHKLLDVTLNAEKLKSELLYKRILQIVDSLDFEDRINLSNLAIAKYKMLYYFLSKI